MTEPSQILRWADPNQTRRESASIADEYAACVPELIARIGEWAVIYCGNDAQGQRIANSIRSNKGAFKATPERRFEVSVRLKPKDHTWRGDPQREHEVFVRCVAGHGASS